MVLHICLNDENKLLKFKPFYRVNLVFPDIGKQIDTRWGTAELNEYISDIFFEYRNNVRKEFPLKAIRDLYKILDFHSALYEEYSHKIEIQVANDGIWDLSK